MRFVIVGAGAVGGTVGACLHQAGFDVLLVARGEHARVLAESGMDFQTPVVRKQLRIPVADGVDAVELGDDDVLVMTTKTQDSLPLLKSLAGMRTASGRSGSSLPVVCMQNGVENERLAARRFDDVYGVCVMLPATRLEPGVVLANGTPHAGMLDIGRWPSGVDDTTVAIADALAKANFVSTAEPQIMRWKYAKLLRNLGNAIEALTGGDAAEVFGSVRAEADAVLAAAGVDVTPDVEWKQRRGTKVDIGEIAGTSRGGGSSWQSLTTGAGSIEADYLNGEIAYLARAAGVPAPRKRGPATARQPGGAHACQARLDERRRARLGAGRGSRWGRWRLWG